MLHSLNSTRITNVLCTITVIMAMPLEQWVYWMLTSPSNAKNMKYTTEQTRAIASKPAGFVDLN